MDFTATATVTATATAPAVPGTTTSIKETTLQIMASQKILSLLIRTASKPLANSLKREAANSETFKRICVNVAQTYHRVEENLKMNFLGYKRETIRPLNEARAIELGTNFLAEFVVFGIAGTLIVAETIRSSQSTSRRNALIDEKLASLQDTCAKQEKDIETLRQRVDIIENTALRKPLLSTPEQTTLKGWLW